MRKFLPKLTLSDSMPNGTRKLTAVCKIVDLGNSRSEAQVNWAEDHEMVKLHMPQAINFLLF